MTQSPGRLRHVVALLALASVTSPVASWAGRPGKGPVKVFIMAGPTYNKHRLDGRSVIVEFDNVGRGLMAGRARTGKPVQPVPDAKPGGFQLAGADGKWHDAAAAIKGDTVIVTCEKVQRPVAVRYARAPEPTAANLYNHAAFPAMPFSTTAAGISAVK